MSLEQNKAIARRHFDELWTNGDLAVADVIYSPASVGHCGNLPDQTGYPQCEKELVRQDLVAFPDGVASVEDQIAEGDKVLTRWRFRGTHLAGLYGHPATGNEISVTGFHVHRIWPASQPRITLRPADDRSIRPSAGDTASRW